MPSELDLQTTLLLRVHDAVVRRRAPPFRNGTDGLDIICIHASPRMITDVCDDIRALPESFVTTKEFDD